MRALALLAITLITGCASVAQSPSMMPAAMPPLAGRDVALTAEPASAQAPPELQPATGAIYNPGTSITLFQDRKAHRIGDVITVLLVEKTQAQKSARTSTDKSSEIEASAPTVLGQEIKLNGKPAFDTSLSAERSFSGSGESSQSNKLEGTVTVTVAEVYANNSLRVRGEKTIAINQGEERIQIEGVIRPEDIAPDNSVPSSRVADMRVVYSGKGSLADANAQGWLSRFFNSPWFPF